MKKGVLALRSFARQASKKKIFDRSYQKFYRWLWSRASQGRTHPAPSFLNWMQIRVIHLKKPCCSHTNPDIAMLAPSIYCLAFLRSMIEVSVKFFLCPEWIWTRFKNRSMLPWAGSTNFLTWTMSQMLWKSWKTWQRRRNHMSHSLRQQEKRKKQQNDALQPRWMHLPLI